MQPSYSAMNQTQQGEKRTVTTLNRQELTLTIPQSNHHGASMMDMSPAYQLPSPSFNNFMLTLSPLMQLSSPQLTMSPRDDLHAPCLSGVPHVPSTMTPMVNTADEVPFAFQPGNDNAHVPSISSANHPSHSVVGPPPDVNPSSQSQGGHIPNENHDHHRHHHDHDNLVDSSNVLADKFHLMQMDSHLNEDKGVAAAAAASCLVHEDDPTSGAVSAAVTSVGTYGTEIAHLQPSSPVKEYFQQHGHGGDVEEEEEEEEEEGYYSSSSSSDGTNINIGGVEDESDYFRGDFSGPKAGSRRSSTPANATTTIHNNKKYLVAPPARRHSSVESTLPPRRGASSSSTSSSSSSSSRSSLGSNAGSTRAVLNASPVNGPAATQGPKKCNCKKSKCLKLYCECFAMGAYCQDDCKCVDCNNTTYFEAQRSQAIQSILSRNPNAFTEKIQIIGTPGGAVDRPNGGDFRRASGRDHGEETTMVGGMQGQASVVAPQAAHVRGCNCKKSLCIKKYCECFFAGVYCGENCQCEGCQNTAEYAPAASAPPKKKASRSVKRESAAAAAAAEEKLPPSTPSLMTA